LTNKVGQTEFIIRSVDGRPQVSVCSGYDVSHPRYHSHTQDSTVTSLYDKFGRCGS